MERPSQPAGTTDRGTRAYQQGNYIGAFEESGRVGAPDYDGEVDKSVHPKWIDFGPLRLVKNAESGRRNEALYGSIDKPQDPLYRRNESGRLVKYDGRGPVFDSGWWKPVDTGASVVAAASSDYQA